jgi:hypothetical protein
MTKNFLTFDILSVSIDGLCVVGEGEHLAVELTKESASAESIDDFKRTRLSCGLMLPLLAHPIPRPLPSASCLSF